MTEQELENAIINIKCCSSSLLHKTIMYELLGQDTECVFNQTVYLQFLNEVLCRYLSAIQAEVTPCLTEDEIENIIQEAQQICGCCYCSDQLPINKDSIITIIPTPVAQCTFFRQEFYNLTSGNQITLTWTPCPGTQVIVFRNGNRHDDIDDITIDGKVITMVNPFGISAGSGSSGESVYVEYYQNGL